MATTDAVLAYLGELTEKDRTFSPNVGRVIFVGTNPLSASGALRRMAATDLLRKDEHLVREGNLWILGTINGVKYQWPIRQRRVSLGGRLAARTGLVSADPQEPWTLPPGLIEPAILKAISLGHPYWGTDFFPTPAAHPGDPQGAIERVSDFIGDYLKAAGLPDLEIRSEKTPAGESDPYLLVSRGFYLEQHPLALNRTAALKLWQGEDLTDTAMAALYRDSEPDGDADEDDATVDQRVVGATQPDPIDETPIRAPLPLNRAQRHAIKLSRRQPITVVSGPPGTGKSHLVAATAIDQVARGRSVLVASQTLHARDAVLDLLERYPMVEALRFGDGTSARQLGDKLAAGIVGSRMDAQDVRKGCTHIEERIATHRQRIGRRIGDLAGFEEALIRRHDVPLWLAHHDLDAINLDAAKAAIDDLGAGGLFGWFRRRAAQKVLQREFTERPPLDRDALNELIEIVAAEQLVSATAGRNLGLDELWDELDRLEESWRQHIGDLLDVERRERGGGKHHQALQQLASALRMGVLQRREALTEIGPRFLQVAPLWVGTLGEIEAVLPVSPGLFDLVILDESSQIAQASAVAALARARRALIVGDSRQLRHISFVSDAVQNEAADRHGLSPQLKSQLNDRTNSIFDAATATGASIELDEHFRSAPHIIGFSDRTFYDHRLRLMTQHPRNEDRDAIEVHFVDGHRDASKVVLAEVSMVMTLVRDLIEAGTDSIGIVSPFRAQADALETALVDGLRLEEIANHGIRVGTVHSFQGAERDHMIISIGLGPDDTRALRFVEDPAVFNVMVTRARTHVSVVTSLGPDQAGTGLLASYLRHANEPPMLQREKLGATGWTARVADDLAEQTSARIVTDYDVAGETIDIVVGAGDNAFGIETEVHPAGTERHIERRLALKRAGWDIVSLHRASCYGREEEVIAELLARIHRTIAT